MLQVCSLIAQLQTLGACTLLAVYHPAEVMPEGREAFEAKLCALGPALPPECHSAALRTLWRCLQHATYEYGVCSALMDDLVGLCC